MITDKNTKENDKTKVYAARIKDRSVLLNSSSGGMFTALSDSVLSNFGAVACSIYNYKERRTEYKLITDIPQRDEARGSKYMQSNPLNIFDECVMWLKNNPDKKLLFVGTGCYAAGFKSFIKTKGLEQRTYIVDLICYGAPSPKLWGEYAAYLEKRCGGISSNLNFKDKRNGWNTPTAVMKINGEEVFLKEFTRFFNTNCALRPSCYKCPYATIKRSTDMTIGDFWGIENALPDFYDKNGNSLVLIHTQKGEELFKSVEEKIDFSESTVEDCLQPNLQRPTSMPDKRTVFWQDYSKQGIEYMIKKYGTSSFVNRVKSKIKRILKR